MLGLAEGGTGKSGPLAEGEMVHDCMGASDDHRGRCLVPGHGEDVVVIVDRYNRLVVMSGIKTKYESRCPNIYMVVLDKEISSYVVLVWNYITANQPRSAK